MRRGLLLLLTVVACVSLSGCFWGLFGGTVKVQNDTEASIHVQADRNYTSGDVTGYNASYALMLRSDDATYVSFDWFTFRPKIYVEYQGKTLTYYAHFNALGYDSININAIDFIRGSN